MGRRPSGCLSASVLFSDPVIELYCQAAEGDAILRQREAPTICNPRGNSVNAIARREMLPPMIASLIAVKAAFLATFLIGTAIGIVIGALACAAFMIWGTGEREETR